ncbi:MAG: hypothetical protein OXG84_17310 [Chloroflexi bacterium]|nr:hypothetical protein [Chloroflexota bacterium]
MTIKNTDDVVRELEEISDKLGSSRYSDNVGYKLDKVNEKLDRMIRLLESIEQKLGGSSY